MRRDVIMAQILIRQAQTSFFSVHTTALEINVSQKSFPQTDLPKASLAATKKTCECVDNSLKDTVTALFVYVPVFVGTRSLILHHT